MDKLSQRASDIDKIINSGISEKLSVENAEKIMHIWGRFLEHTSFLMLLFGTDIPESLLPYKKDILVGALNKMMVFYKSAGKDEVARKINETLMGLVSYTNDEEALMRAAKNYNNPEWLKTFLPALKEHQNDMAEDGFIVDGKIWKLTL